MAPNPPSPEVRQDVWGELNPTAPPAGTQADQTSYPPSVQLAMDRLEGLLNESRTLPEAMGLALLEGVEPADLVEATQLLRLDETSFDEGGPDHDLEPFRRQVDLFNDARLLAPGEAPERGKNAQRALNAGRLVLVGDAKLRSEFSALIRRTGTTRIDDVETDTGGLAASLVDENSTSDSARERLVVAMFKDSRTDLAEVVNRVCVQAGCALLVFRQYPLSVAIGPLMVPAETGCLHCLLQHERAVRGTEDLRSFAGIEEVAMLNFAFGLDFLTFEAVRWLAGCDVATLSKVWRWDLVSGSTHFSPVLKLPRCSVCGIHNLRPQRRVWEE